MDETVKGYFIIRPQWEVVRAGAGLTICSCGGTLWGPTDTREHWQLGHFDFVINPGDAGYDELARKEEQ